MRPASTEDLHDLLRNAVGEVLGRPGNELHDRAFVELGGSSLDAVRAALRLRERFGVELTARQLLSTGDLDSLLRQVGPSSTDPAPQLDPVPQTGEVVPLTWQQRIVWYQSMLEGASPRYHFYALLHFEQVPDVEQLRRALARLVRRHPVLRSWVLFRDGDPWLQVPPVEAVDAPELPVVKLAEPAPTSEELVSATGADSSFNLYSGPLARWRLAMSPDGRATLVHAEHHLVHDGRSFVVLLDTLADSSDYPADLRYFTYAARQRPASSRDIDQVVANCRKVETALFHRLPAESAGPDHFLRLSIPYDLLTNVRAAAQDASVSLFSALFTAFAQALAEHQDVDKLIIGTAVENRPAGYEDAVGMFVSTVPVTAVRQAGESYEAALRRSEAALSRSIGRADIPITEVVRAIGGVDMRRREALLHATFSMHQQLDDEVEIARQRARVEVGVFNGAAKFPVNVIAIATGTGAGTRVKLLLEGAGEYLTEDDLWGLWTRMILWLRGWSQTGQRDSRVADPDAFSVVQRVTDHAERRGSSPALDDGVHQVTYGDLARLGAGARSNLDLCGRTIGILGSASTRFFASAYTAVHAGAAYVPLGVDQPVDRLVEMVRSAGCDAIINVTDEHAHTHVERLRETTDVRWVDWTDLSRARADEAGRAATGMPTDLAYIMFTSGSSGTPKGVMVTRESLGLAAAWAAAELELSPGLVIGQTTNITFDASAFEVWSGLHAGVQIKVAPADVRSDPRLLARWLDDMGVQYTFLATPIAELMMRREDSYPSQLRLLSTAGDRLHPIPPHLTYRVTNMYGPTEATIVATAERVQPGGTALPSIGRAVPYAYPRVVAADGSVVPEGGQGELWIGGEGVARGYVGDPNLTAARFVADPYSADGSVAYRTGDLVRSRPDGKLDFIARKDRQVKIGGIRTELGEIEAVALRLRGVRQAVAEAGAGDRRSSVRLFVVPAAGADEEATAQEIRSALPTHLRHLTVTFVGRIPLTRSGKVDRAQLAERSVKATRPVPAAVAEDGRRDAARLLAPVTRQLPMKEAIALAHRLVRSVADMADGVDREGK